jgi:hypothetical protein
LVGFEPENCFGWSHAMEIVKEPVKILCVEDERNVLRVFIVGRNEPI